MRLFFNIAANSDVTESKIKANSTPSVYLLSKWLGRFM